MANEEHLTRLKEGAEAWNQWREVNPEIKPDLTGANLSAITFRELDLAGVNFREVDLTRASLVGALSTCWGFYNMTYLPYEHISPNRPL
jgi:uncharacterized protein YjbI with pentapeptide repeats